MCHKGIGGQECVGSRNPRSGWCRRPNWRLQSTPNPTGSTASGLTGASCTSLTRCTAVGDTTQTGTTVQYTLAEQWRPSARSAPAGSGRVGPEEPFVESTPRLSLHTAEELACGA